MLEIGMLECRDVGDWDWVCGCLGDYGRPRWLDWRQYDAESSFGQDAGVRKEVKLNLFWVKLLTCFLTPVSASGRDSASYWCQSNQQSRPSSPNNQTQSQSPTPRHPTFQSPIQSPFIIEDDLFTFDVDTVWTKAIQVPYNFNGKYG